KHAARLEPSVGMLQEKRFQPLASAILAGDGVVRRVQEHARARLDLAIHIEAVTVNHLIEPLTRLFRSIGVQLNATALALGALRNNGESLSFARARVERGETRSRKF